MNKNTLLIGGAIIVMGGAIATGAFLNNSGFDSSKQNSSDLKLDENQREGIEESIFQDFSDEDKYSFCQGREEIKGPYISSVFGEEKGNIEYISDDISVFDKEKNKLFILGRKIQYKYSGAAQMNAPGGEGTVNIEESGMTVEYYDMFSAPVRIDYNAKIINPAPERKNSDWVVIERKGVGTVMGFTQESVDTTMGDAKTFCPSFALNNAFISPDYFSFEKSCSDLSSGLGFSFSGNFKFECGGVDNEKGIEIVKEYKLLEEARNTLNSSSDADDDETDEFGDIIKEEQSDDKDIKKKLEELQEDIKADFGSQ